MSAVISDEHQRTIAERTEFRGTGLFTSVGVTATLYPADPDTGIVFRRSDLPGRPSAAAHVDHALERPRRTALRVGSDSVETVEHCLAALVGMGVDNVVVELDGPEVPAGDGSAEPFVRAIEAVGTVEQPATRDPLVITEPLTVRDAEVTAAALPSDAVGMELMYVLDYGERSHIRPQICNFTVDAQTRGGTFARQVAPARTFSTLAEAEEAQRAGLFKHLTARDMLVIGPSGPVDNELRFHDEPARHKLLDLMGDLALVGRPIRGRIVAVRSGHAINRRLARELVDSARQVDQRPAPPAMDIRRILSLLPHRYPMILVDRVTEMEPGKRAIGVKNVSFNEPFFQGHYPEAPIMPGVLIVEAMSQLAGLMLNQTIDHQGKVAVLLSIDAVKLRKPVTPGDQLVLEAEAIKANSRMGEAQCRAYVSGELAAEARVKFMMVPPEQATS
jgi:UDP-3-O-[3-hydroxymyristoyl] N-acetylglucosamine deacetylase/3-hydroxyacyl-[acyl-carrier-protein] dehydratase